ncbi:MAG: hypothetical protein ACI37Q_04250 [Candidatus Gastranaerophilaceae bacterium]
MSNTLLEKFFSILFKLPDGRSMEDYYKTVALIAPIASGELKSGKTFPESGLLVAASLDVVAEYFAEASQVYKEATAIFNQKSNTQTTSQIKYLFIFKKGESDTYVEALNKAKAINTKFAQVAMTSRTAADIIDVAGWCLSNKRFLSATIDLTDIADIATLKTGLNNYAYILARKSANLTEGIGSAVASTTTKGYFGGTKGSAQFTQLVGITPEQLTDSEISALDAANIGYYSNVSPVDGGGAEDFGYNWVIGSKMIGGTLRQRMMIMDYVEKAMALKTLEFLNTKPGYDEDGNATLWGMLQVLGRSLQTYELIVPDTEEVAGFVFNVQRIRGTADSIQNNDIEAYNGKKFKIYGYYYDKITGEKVDVNLVVDPTSMEVENLLA